MRTTVSAAVIILASSTPSFSQCVNTIEPTCSAYRSCFNEFCDCSQSETDYFLSFGERYCKAFLSNKDFSSQGKQWRDSALRCLQETLVPLIPLEKNKDCDCEGIRRFAIDSHVSCYAAVSPSVCNLSLEDLAEIGKTVVFDTAFIEVVKNEKEFADQVTKVFSQCSESASDQERRQRWKFLSKLFSSKVE